MPAALQLARALNAPLHLIHVTEGEQMANAKEVDTARGHFAAYAKELVERGGFPAPAHTATLVDGPAARTLLDFAAGARFMVLASHGRGGLMATLIGSVADKIVRGATVPTLVIPLGASESLAGPILVGVDGSPEAEEGVALAREIAPLLGAKLAFVRAWRIPTPVSVEFAGYPADLATTMEDAATSYLAGLAKPGEQTVCALGSAVDVITQAADQLNAGLVVLTSHGKGFAHRIALGSVTDGALHTLKRPVLVVPVGSRS